MELAQQFFVYDLRAMLLQAFQPYAKEVDLIAVGYNVPTTPSSSLIQTVKVRSQMRKL